MTSNGMKFINIVTFQSFLLRMTLLEAMKILGLNKPITMKTLQERFQLLYSRNDENGSLYIRKKVEKNL